MKKLLAVSALADVAGGEAMLLRTLPELAKRDWSVRLAVPADGALSAAADELGIETVRLPLGPPDRRSAAAIAGALRAPRAARAVDALLLNGLSTQRLVPSLALARRRAVLHVTNPLHSAPAAWGRPGFWRVVSHVVADSQASARECLAAGAPAGRVHALLPPAWAGDSPAARPTPAERNGAGQRVGFVGRLEPRKGVAGLIEAASSFLADRPQATLTIVGAPPRGDPDDYAGRLPAVARASGFGARIELTGWRADMAAGLHEFDLLVVPSLAEPFGTVAAEAAAAGVPVVASRVGGLREVVRDGVTGVLVDPGDVPALARAVGELLDDRSLRRRLGGEARRQAKRRFAPGPYAERLDALLREAAR
ncbi:MAG TPA: glycosyltransferase family 4 protein [Solirubrobacteraceae bacterium]|nr:glycosyltransferase family 4 protein [Solirubrobacteraceae bacterium]